MAKWTVTGSATKFERYSTRFMTGSVSVQATALSVSVEASSAGHAHDGVVEALDASGWRDIKLTGINQEV